MYAAKVSLTAKEMARSTAAIHAFKVFMDEPPALGGKDGAPSPLDFLLVAHAGCLNYMTHFIAKEMGIAIEGTEITVSGGLDPAKFAGTDMNVRAGYQSIEVEITVRSAAPAAEIERLKAAVEARCPVSDNLANPTPVSISMKAG